MRIVLHEKFLPEARLPFSIVKGSVKSRKIMAEKQFKNFYKEINHYWNGKYCSVDILRETLDKQLYPNKINYVILNEENQKFAGSHGCSVKVTPGENGELNLNHTGYKFLLPLDSTKNNILNKYTALHEARHFFDHLYNPKYSLIRCGKSINHEQSKEDYEKLHELFLTDLNKPIKMKSFKKDTEIILKRIPNDVLIDGLQNIRNALQTEINAYKEEIKCLMKDYKFLDALILKLFLNTNCKFKAKLKYTNQKLKELICIERQALRNQRHQ